MRNITERAVILAQGRALEFDVLLNGASVDLTSFEQRAADRAEPEYLTESEMRRRERKNLLAILQKTGWKIKGSDGAAELLGVKANTLIARIKKMGFKRPLERMQETSSRA